MSNDQELRRLDALERAAGVTEARRVVFIVSYDGEPQPISYRESVLSEAPHVIVRWPMYTEDLDDQR